MLNSKKITALLILSFLFAGLLFTSGYATILRQFTIAALAEEAELIFRGKVIHQESGWDAARSRIWTHVTFAVEEVIKGQHEEMHLVLRFPGGVIAAEDKKMQVDGVPLFNEGEESIIFCSLDSERLVPILGWERGRFRLRFDDTLQRKVIREEDLQWLRQERQRSVPGADVSLLTPFEDFIIEIRTMLMNSPKANIVP